MRVDNNRVEKVDVLGLSIDTLSMEEILDAVEGSISSRKSLKIFYANAHVVLMAKRYPELGAHLRSADIILPDGSGIVLASRILGIPIRKRVIGLDVLLRLSETASKKGWRMYLLGAREEVLKRSVGILEKKFNGLKIIGYHHGYFSADEEQIIINDIAHKKPDIVVVCMGVGRQEKFIIKHSQFLNAPVFFGNGAAIDFIARRLKRAPIWMQVCGLEWIYRFFQEPLRLWKRYTVGNLLFAAMILKEWIKRDSKKMTTG